MSRPPVVLLLLMLRHLELPAITPDQGTGQGKEGGGGAEEEVHLVQCQNCYNSGTGTNRFFRCGGCKVSHYCSRECQKANWPIHKKICQKMKNGRDQLGDDLQEEYLSWKARHFNDFSDLINATVYTNQEYAGATYHTHCAMISLKRTGTAKFCVEKYDAVPYELIPLVLGVGASKNIEAARENSCDQPGYVVGVGIMSVDFDDGNPPNMRTQPCPNHEQALLGFIRDGKLRPPEYYAQRLNSGARFTKADFVRDQRERLADSVEDVNSLKTCHECFLMEEQGQKFQVCSKCKAVSYCSKRCQKKHWPKHKDLCRRLQQFTATAGPAAGGGPAAPLPPLAQSWQALYRRHDALFHELAVAALVRAARAALGPRAAPAALARHCAGPLARARCVLVPVAPGPPPRVRPAQAVPFAELAARPGLGGPEAPARVETLRGMAAGMAQQLSEGGMATFLWAAEVTGGGQLMLMWVLHVGRDGRRDGDLMAHREGVPKETSPRGGVEDWGWPRSQRGLGTGTNTRSDRGEGGRAAS